MPPNLSHHRERSLQDVAETHGAIVQEPVQPVLHDVRRHLLNAQIAPGKVPGYLKAFATSEDGALDGFRERARPHILRVRDDLSKQQFHETLHTQQAFCKMDGHMTNLFV